MTKTIFLFIFLVLSLFSFGQTCIGSNTTGTHNNCYLNTSKQANINLLNADSVIAGKWYGTAIDIPYGGTGAVTANAALNNLLPSQSGNSNKVLITDGTNTSWQPIGTEKRTELYSGTTNSSGEYTVTFSESFSVTPNIQANVVNQSATNQFIRISSISTTGFTVNVFQRNSVNLLGVDVLLSTTTNVNGASIDVLISEK